MKNRIKFSEIREKIILSLKNKIDIEGGGNFFLIEGFSFLETFSEYPVKNPPKEKRTLIMITIVRERDGRVYNIALKSLIPEILE